MVVRRLAVSTIAMGCLLFGQDQARENIRVSRTERMDFPAGGVVHLKHSIGELKVEGWDEPAMELTVTKSPPLRYDSHWSEKAYPLRDLEAVRVTSERQEDEVVITTTFPNHRSFPPPSPLRGSSAVKLNYLIKVPRNARLFIEDQEGEVYIEDLVGEIHATTIRGEIALRIPEECNYAIDAKSDFGNVISDFPGRERRRFWPFGHRFVPDGTPAGKRLYLRAGFGDIIIQKIRRPPTPHPMVHQ